MQEVCLGADVLGGDCWSCERGGCVWGGLGRGEAALVGRECWL